MADNALFGIHGAALQVRAQRMGMLASNIANASTPGFKAKDVDFRAALAGAPADHLRFAVLIDNVSSAAKVEYRATTIDRVVTKDWFVFPWEAVASRASILSDWGEVPERTS